MKNLWLIGLFMFFAMACSEQAREEISTNMDSFEHPKYVLDAVNKHIQDERVKSMFLSGIEYNEGIHITSLDLTSLDAMYSDKMLSLFTDLLGAKLVVLDYKTKNSFACLRCTNLGCLCVCSNPGYRPDSPMGACVSGGSGCMEWFWVC